jgi:hypothetical protein
MPSLPVFPERSTGPDAPTLASATGLPLLSVISTVTAGVVLVPRGCEAAPAPRDGGVCGDPAAGGGGVCGDPAAGGCGVCAAALTTANAQVKDKGRNLIDLM